MIRLISCCVLAALVFASAVAAQVAEGVGVLNPSEDRARFIVYLDPPLNDQLFSPVIDTDGVWQVLKDGQPVEESSFRVASVAVDPDDGEEDPPDTNLVTGIAVEIREFDRYASYEFGPAPQLSNELNERGLSADQLLETRKLWNGLDREPTKLRDGFTRLLSGDAVTIDVLPTTEGAVDLEYDLDLRHGISETKTDGARAWSTLAASLESTGYLRIPDGGDDDSTNDNDPLDSVVTSIKLEHSWTRFKAASGEANPLAMNADEIREARHNGTFDPFDVTVDLHLKHETDADFDDDQFAAGLGVSTTVPFPRLFEGIPAPLLPLAPVLLHNRDGLAQIQQPWFALSLDHVFHSDESTREALTSDDEYTRVLFEVAWTSEVVAPNTWLYANFSTWWELDAPEAVRSADRDHRHFAEIGVKIPVTRDNKTSHFIVKYQDGSLPPHFENDTQLSAGVSFGF